MLNVGGDLLSHTQPGAVPSALEGLDPAFGMGPGRIALQRYRIPDIRILYDSDVRFLDQIAR